MSTTGMIFAIIGVIAWVWLQVVLSLKIYKIGFKKGGTLVLNEWKKFNAQVGESNEKE